MKTYNEIKSVIEAIENEGQIVISKPEVLSAEEWFYYNELEKLENAKQQAQNQVFSFERQIEDFKAQNGEF